MTYYISYGSNLNKEQMKYRCPGAKAVAVTMLKNHRLVFQGRKYGAHANVIKAPGYQVPVAFWKINEEHERALDIYEGVRGGYYTKEYVPINVDGKPEKALIYIMTPNDYGVPTDEYYKTIERGYEDFGMNESYLEEAFDDSFNKVSIDDYYSHLENK